VRTDEIDEIIASAVAESKGKGQDPGGRRRKRNRVSIDKVRAVLNVVFMIGFAAAVLIYFLFPEQKTLFFSVGFGALILKIIEFVLRFLF
jgi:hypothetical protein